MTSGRPWEHRVRGMVVGLSLGDTLGHTYGTGPATGPLRAGVGTQLAAFTVEGIIRAWMRMAHKGICHEPSVVWHAYCRWAAIQGIEADAMRRRWTVYSTDSWPDGWLAQVPALAERRGNAPATVAALRQLEPGTPDRPTTGSRGCHALLRTLPLGAVAGHAGMLTQFAREVAALTHGDVHAQAATSVAVHSVGHALTAPTLNDALRAALAVRDADLGTGVASDVDTAHMEAESRPGDIRRLQKLAPASTAPAALCGGVYTAMSYPDPADVMKALRFAATAPHPSSVTAVTGALLGALHGVDVWPVELVSRHELAWVLDTLARDLVLQLTDNPGGAEYDEPRDPGWWDRYPGW